jgi:hypothetical protein
LTTGQGCVLERQGTMKADEVMTVDLFEEDTDDEDVAMRMPFLILMFRNQVTTTMTKEI